MIFSPLAGYLYDRFGFKVVFYAYFLAAVSYPVTGIPQKLESFIPCLVIVALSFSFSGPLMAEMAKVVPKEFYAKTYGLLNVAIAFGMFFGPIVGVFVYGSYHWFGVCVMMGIFSLMYIPFVWNYKSPSMNIQLE